MTKGVCIAEVLTIAGVFVAVRFERERPLGILPGLVMQRASVARYTYKSIGNWSAKQPATSVDTSYCR